MSGYSDDYDRDRGDDRGRRGGPERALEDARRALSAPGLFVILNALFGLFVVALLSIPMVIRPEMLVDTMRNILANQPQGQQRKEQEEKLDELEREIQQNKAALQMENTIKLGVAVVCNLIALVGGLAIRSVGSYGLGMTGAIVSIVPCVTGCCVTGMPFGIWALVVLVRPEVKEGFAAKRRLASGPPDQY